MPAIQVEEGETAVFTLKNGDEIHVMMDAEGRLTAGHYRLKITSVSRGAPLVVLPGSGNAIEVSTPRALAVEEAEVVRIAGERRSKA